MFQRTELDNGLPVLTTSMPHTQSVSMAIFVGAGSRYEADEIAGVSHFLEHLLFKGTKNWPTARVISEEIEGIPLPRAPAVQGHQKLAHRQGD
jgi:predicted Zn-dependent peptidase